MGLNKEHPILVDFSMPRVGKMCLALNEPKSVALHPNSNTTSKDTPS